MNEQKYIVYFLDEQYRQNFMHIFASSKEDAEKIVMTDGVGYYGDHKTYARKIIRTEEVKPHAEQ